MVVGGRDVLVAALGEVGEAQGRLRLSRPSTARRFDSSTLPLDSMRSVGRLVGAPSWVSGAPVGMAGIGQPPRRAGSTPAPPDLWGVSVLTQ